MKYALLLLIIFFTCRGNAQLSERNQHRIDSLYPVALDENNSAIQRCKAYSRCCWASVHQDYNLGLKYSSEYFSLATDNNLYSHLANAAHFKGYSQMMLGEFEAANRSYLRGLAVALKNDNYKRIAQIYGDLGNLRNAEGQTKDALGYHKKCLEIAKDNDLKVQQARAKINMGEIYEDQGNYKESLQMFQEALSICKANTFGGYLSSIFESIGDINLSIKEYKTAEKNYELALEYAIKFQNVNREIQSLQKLGKLNQELNATHVATVYYEKALVLASKKDVPILEVKLLSDLANNSLKQEQYSKAIKYITASIALYQKHDIKEGLDEAFLIAAEIYAALNQKKRSKSFYEKSYALAEESNNITSLTSTSKALAAIFETNGNQAQSIKFYKEYINYSNQKRNEDDVKEIIRMELSTNYRNKRREDSLVKVNEIHLLEVEHGRKEAKTELQSYMAYSGMGVLALILCFVGYFFIQKRRSALILGEKNEIISQALSDKEILLKEVHHRVKNNMQIVSSILHLKSVNTPDALAKSALLDSKKRIDAMQLAHQKMYQKGNYEQIDIDEYSRDIMALLLAPIETEHDTFKVHGESLFIHVEQAQTLGFIIHELIANSIKYAWTEGQVKSIEISIKQMSNTIHFDYHDNGIGVPNDFDFKNAKSFGMKMIHALAVRQLLGKIDIQNQTGFKAMIRFDGR